VSPVYFLVSSFDTLQGRCTVGRLSRVDGPLAAPYTYHFRRGVEQLVARQAHNLEVGGSNPPPATKFSVWMHHSTLSNWERCQATVEHSFCSSHTAALKSKHFYSGLT
jgi:hypothetical protein